MPAKQPAREYEYQRRTTERRPGVKRLTPECAGCAAYVSGAPALSVLAARVGWRGAATLRRQATPALCTWGRRLMILDVARPRHCALLARRRPV